MSVELGFGFYWVRVSFSFLLILGDPEYCRMMDDSPDDLGVSNAWDSSGERGAFGGGPSCGA